MEFCFQSVSFIMVIGTLTRIVTFYSLPIRIQTVIYMCSVRHYGTKKEAFYFSCKEASGSSMLHGEGSCTQHCPTSTCPGKLFSAVSIFENKAVTYLEFFLSPKKPHAQEKEPMLGKIYYQNKKMSTGSNTPDQINSCNKRKTTVISTHLSV